MQFLLRTKLDYQIFMLILIFEKLYLSLLSVRFRLGVHASCVFVVHAVTSWLINLFWGLTDSFLHEIREQGEPWDLDGVLTVNRLWVMFELRFEISHWDLTKMFSDFHVFSILLFYLKNCLHMTWTNQGDLISLYRILCFLFLVLAKKIEKLLENINCILK